MEVTRAFSQADAARSYRSGAVGAANDSAPVQLVCVVRIGVSLNEDEDGGMDGVFQVGVPTGTAGSRRGKIKS